MKNKKIVIVLMFILFSCIFTRTTYATDEIEVSLEVDRKNVKAGDELAVTVSITNNSYEEMLAIVAGMIEYDDKLLKPITVDTSDLTSEQQMMITLLKDSGEMEFDVLSAKDKWILGMANVEDEPDVKTIVMLYLDMSGEETAVEIGDTKEIGEIKFEVLETEEEETTNVKFTELTLDEEIEIEEAATSQIKIEAKASILDEMEKVDDGKDKKQEQVGSKPDQAKKEYVYTGAEDVIPYMVLLIVVAIVSCVKCVKYKDI